MCTYLKNKKHSKCPNTDIIHHRHIISNGCLCKHHNDIVERFEHHQLPQSIRSNPNPSKRKHHSRRSNSNTSLPPHVSPCKLHMTIEIVPGEKEQQGGAGDELEPGCLVGIGNHAFVVLDGHVVSFVAVHHGLGTELD